MEHFSREYDVELRMLPHFRAYQQMLPFVGRSYGCFGNPRILVIAESNYFPRDRAVPSAQEWYAGSSQRLTSDEIGYTNTREVISCGKFQKWKRGGMRMFGNIERELIAAGLPKEENSFVHVAFMNAFQRPAPFQGTIKTVFEEQDGEVSAGAINHTIQTIKPNWVCVVSSYSWGVLNQQIQQEAVSYEHTSHALCRWWHRAAKGRAVNKEIFRGFIQKALTNR
jgi:hypothetical protein